MQVPLGDTYYGKFTTRSFSTGVPTTLAGTPVLSVYEENNVTQITTGVSVTADYDSVTGLNEWAVVATSGNGYEAGKYYDIVITTGTVGGVSVVGEVVGHFRIMPAEDAGAGIPDVNVTNVGDTAQTAGDLANLITTVDTVVDGIQTDLDNGTDGLGALKALIDALNDLSAAQVNTEVDTALSDIRLNELMSVALTAQPTVGSLLGDLTEDNAGTQRFTIASLTQAWSVATRILTASTNFNDLSAAQVNAEVVDALATDTYAEPGQGAPAATTTLAAKINYLYKAWRNKSDQDATTYQLYDDAGTTVDQKATISDSAGTFTKGEVATGP